MKKIFSILITLVAVIALASVNVQAQASAPAFSSCNSQSGDGDKAHYEYGVHQILGNGLEEGADDVYTLEAGNFLQCFCGLEDNGIQTNWWKIGDLSQEEIDQFVSQGWIYESNGLQWNLEDSAYLGKNSNYNCGESTPTPTPGKSTPTPTPTPHNVDPGCHGEARCAGPADPPICTDKQPEAPVLLSVTQSGTDGVELVWTEAKEAQYYLISYGLESGNYVYGVPNVGKVQSFRIGELDLSKKYYFTVRSHRGCAPSEESNELSYPREIGGQVLGLAITGVDTNILKIIGGIISGTTLAGYSLRKILTLS